jgi:hypothetical protein
VSKEYINFGDNGKSRVLLVGIVKVSENVNLKLVALVKSLGFNILSIAQHLEEVFEVHSRRVRLVFSILEVILYARSSSRVRFSELIFLSLSVLHVVWLLLFRQSFGNGIGG